jgi:hypothetical protein
MLLPATSFGGVVAIVVLCVLLIPLVVWRWNHDPVPIFKRFSRRKRS